MYVTSGISVLVGTAISKNHPEIGRSLMEGGFCGMLATNIIDRMTKGNKPAETGEEMMKNYSNQAHCYCLSRLATIIFVLKAISGVTDMESIPVSTKNPA